MPFCAAAAVVRGRVGIETFGPATLGDAAHPVPAIAGDDARRSDARSDSAPSRTQARVTVRLRDGRAPIAEANGARGYPDRPASDEQLAVKFTSCATQTLSAAGGRKRARRITRD